MRLALIACSVLQRELSWEIAKSDSVVRVWWLRQGLHDTPEILRRQLQREIDRIEDENAAMPDNMRYDAICLGYGLCSNGVIGLRAGALPIIIPRCDDCISLFLGSSQRYLELFEKYPGTYWYNPGWIEHAFTPSEENYRLRFAEYKEKYDEDNAEYLMEAEREWIKNYRNAIYIESPVYQNSDYPRYTKKAASGFGWAYHQEAGSQSFLHKLLSGNWDEKEFRICAPGGMTKDDWTK